MNLYIAGASAERHVIAKLMEKCRESGITITLDWPAQIEGNGGIANGMHPEDARAYALADLNAIDRADVVWLVAGEASTCGAWVELGYAIARDKHTIVSGNLGRSIFAHVADDSYVDHETAFDRLLVLEPVY